jgi:DNA-binding CsgD family transcriptional regulator
VCGYLCLADRMVEASRCVTVSGWDAEPSVRVRARASDGHLLVCPYDREAGVTLTEFKVLPAAMAADGGVFVGRAGELAALEEAAAAATRGQPKVVLVEGEAGIGKSTLLARFASGLADAAVLRASGDDAELLLPYGVVGQLVACAGGAGGGGPPGLLAGDLSGGVHPLAVGADLVAWLGQFPRMVLAMIDDLHWADAASARALLFAVRRLQADRVLVVVSARPGELPRPGESWQRFLAGDHRASRIRLRGLGLEEVVELGRALGAGELPHRAARRLLEETGGNPLYCRALVDEAETGSLDLGRETLQVPRSLAGVMLARVGALGPAARELVTAAAVLDQQCELVVAAALADLDDPLPALGEAVAAGILVEQLPGTADRFGFTHLLVRRAVYSDLSPARRCRLHERAAGLVDRRRALGHRVAAAVGPDDGLAGELEAASREAGRLGRTAQAAAWLRQAAAVSSDAAAADRRLLDALETLVFSGEVAEAQILAARAAAAEPSARRSQLLGALDFLAGRTAAGEAQLLEAWHTHDRAREASVGAVAAFWLAVLCLAASRIPETIRWGERAAVVGAAPTAVRHNALGVLALSLFLDGQGPEGLARLAFLPAAPAEVPRQDTDTLVLRGMVKVLAEDLPGAIGDLSTATTRLRAGVPLSVAGKCLSYLAGAEWRLGSWDEAALHAELAVSLAHDADRGWDLGLVHGVAAVVPALRGDWAVASAHVRKATEGAQAAGTASMINAALIAQAYLAAACGDLEGVIGAATAVRATGKGQYFLHIMGRHEWQVLEIDALIGLGRLCEAETALAELEGALSRACPVSALVAAGRLRGDLALAAGHHAAAAAAFETALRRARGLQAPLTLAQLEISDARRLRATGQPQPAVARLRSARQRLTTLGARPYMEICDQELAAADALAGPRTAPALVGLTTAEQAVARLVANGRSNRQAAAELYVSVKTVEFHLGHIFDKLGIRSRKDLVTRIGAAPPTP